MTARLDTAVRQEQIAQAALAIIARRGMKQLNVAGVARRVGVVPSAIYRHFRDKEAIVDTVLDLVRDRLLENVRAVRHETDDPMEQLHRLFTRHLALIRDNEALPRVIFSEEVYAGRPERRAGMFRMVQAYLGEVAQIVRVGQRTGSVNAGLDAAAVAMAFLGLVQPAAVLWQMSGGRFDLGAHAAGVWPVFQAALRP